MSRVKEQLAKRQFRHAVVPEGGCAARREQDEMACTSCGVRWSLDDPEGGCADRKAHERRSTQNKKLVTGDRRHPAVIAGRSGKKPTPVGEAALAELRARFDPKV